MPGPEKFRRHFVFDRNGGKEVLETVPDILRKGSWERVTLANGAERLHVTHDRDGPYRAVVALDRDGSDGPWLPTAHRLVEDARSAKVDKRSADERASTALPDAPGQHQDGASAPDFQPDEIADAIAAARAAREADPGATIHIDEDGVTREVSLSDALDDLDRDKALIRAITSCSLKGAPE